MALTKLQKRLRREAEEIAEMVMVDFWNVEKVDRGFRTVTLQIAISRLVIAEVITRYTLFDEVLTDYLCRYYFKKPDRPGFIYWNQKKFRVFVHFMLDEMFLLKRCRWSTRLSRFRRTFVVTAHPSASV